MPKLTLIKLFLLTSIAQLFSPSFACADKENSRFNLDLSAGFENSSQLYIDSIEQTSNSGDSALLLDLKAKAQFKPTKQFTFNSFYSIKSKDFQTDDAFDQLTHLFYFDAVYDLSLLKIGTDYSKADVELDGSDFLSISQRSLHMSKLFNSQLFVRLKRQEQQKSFSNLSERNADNSAIALELFHFFDAGKSFFNIGLNDESEVAVSPEFDFDGISYWVKLSKGFQAFNKNNKIQLGWSRFEKRFQQESERLIADDNMQTRLDNKTVLAIKWELQLSKAIHLVSQLESAKNTSNFEDAQFNANKFGLSVRASF
jgi:hypothetical protein